MKVPCCPVIPPVVVVLLQLLVELGNHHVLPVVSRVFFGAQAKRRTGVFEACDLLEKHPLAVLSAPPPDVREAHLRDLAPVEQRLA